MHRASDTCGKTTNTGGFPSLAWVLGICLLSVLFAGAAAAETQSLLGLSSAERGYWLLLNKPYLPPDFDQETFDSLWQTWSEPARGQAQLATATERRRMSFERYGLDARKDDPAKPLQYVVTPDGQWVMNCLACHQGQVRGAVIPGVPNTLLALETLTEDVRATKLRLGKPLARMEIGSLLMPLGSTIGTTNSVMFGVALMARRDADLNVLPPRPPGPLLHHDMDAPAWWLLARKERMYCDGFAVKSARAIMQFLLVSENGPERFSEWETDFADLYAYIQSLRAPRWPLAIDEALAKRGRIAFAAACASCHGTYGPDASYPARVVPIAEIGTDPLRLHSLTPERRERYQSSWFARHGRQEVLADPGGYVAPPLDGVWASAPYFHNGSVPTLWHVLHPDERPTVWRRSRAGYDAARVGLEATVFDEPPVAAERAEARWYFDTRQPGKSAAGHPFPDALDEADKSAVLEYLKTL